MVVPSCCSIVDCQTFAKRILSPATEKVDLKIEKKRKEKKRTPGRGAAEPWTFVTSCDLPSQRRSPLQVPHRSLHHPNQQPSSSSWEEPQQPSSWVAPPSSSFQQHPSCPWKASSSSRRLPPCRPHPFLPSWRASWEVQQHLRRRLVQLMSDAARHSLSLSCFTTNKPLLLVAFFAGCFLVAFFLSSAASTSINSSPSSLSSSSSFLLAFLAAVADFFFGVFSASLSSLCSAAERLV